MLLSFCKYNTVSDFPVLRHKPHNLITYLANDSEESTSVNSGGNLGDVRLCRYCASFVSYCVSKCFYFEALLDSIQFKIKLIICGIFSQRFGFCRKFSTTLSRLGPSRSFSPWHIVHMDSAEMCRILGIIATPGG